MVMEKGLGRIMKTIILMVIFCMLFNYHYIFAAGNENSWKIECANYNAPTLKAYLYGASQWKSIRFTSASLQTQTGEIRELKFVQGNTIKASEEGTEYLYLIDVTASMQKNNIAVIRKAVLEHFDMLSTKDRMIVYTFGGKAKKILSVKGNEINPKKDAEEKVKKRAKEIKAKAKQKIKNNIRQGKGDGRGSTIYKAMETVMDFAASQDSSDKETDVPLRKVTLLLTDAIDRNFSSSDQITFGEKIKESHTAFYGIGMNPKKLSEKQRTEMETGKGRLEEYCSISGGDWIFEPGNSNQVYKALKKKIRELKNCYVVEFQAENNQISNADEILTITTTDNRSSSKTILANRYQEDTKIPKAAKIKKTAENAISFQFTKAMEGADEVSNYHVKNKDGTVLAIKTVTYNKESHKCEIVFKKELYTGDYTISFENIIDQSMERNVPKKCKFHFEGKSIVVGRMKYILLHFWWMIALTVILLVVYILYKKLKQQGGIVIRDGKATLSSQMSSTLETKLIIDPGKIKTVHMAVTDANHITKNIEIEAEGSIFIGRSKICNICISDPKLSRQHFAIDISQEQAYISDLDTVNGTFVNNKKITKNHLLLAQDVITAGKQTFVFYGVTKTAEKKS